MPSLEARLFFHLEPVHVLRRLHKAAHDNVLDVRWVETQVEASIVEDVATISRVRTTVAIFRIATQETEVFHRYECLFVKLIIDLRTLSDYSQNLSTRFSTAVQVGNQLALIWVRYAGSTQQLLNEVGVRHTSRVPGLDFGTQHPRIGESVLLLLSKDRIVIGC